MCVYNSTKLLINVPISCRRGKCSVSFHYLSIFQQNLSMNINYYSCSKDIPESDGPIKLHFALYLYLFHCALLPEVGAASDRYDRLPRGTCIVYECTALPLQ